MAEDQSKELQEILGVVQPSQEEITKEPELADEVPPEPEKAEVSPETEPVEPKIEEKKPAEPEPEVEEKPAEKVEEPSAEEEVDYKQQVEALTQELLNLSRQLLYGPVPEQQKQEIPPQVPVQPQPVAPVPAQPQPVPATVQDLLPLVSEEQWGQMLENPRLANEVLNRVYSHAVQSTLQVLPQLIQVQMAERFAIQTIHDEFYRNNRDLEPYQDFVSHVAKELYARNRDWQWDKLFDEAGKETRRRLPHLGKKVVAAPAPKPTTVTKPPGSRRSTEKIPEPIADLWDTIDFKPR